MTMSNEEYVSCAGRFCPFCGYSDMEGGPVDIGGGEAWQEVKCATCEKEWLDVYTLSHFGER